MRADIGWQRSIVAAVFLIAGCASTTSVSIHSRVSSTTTGTTDGPSPVTGLPADAGVGSVTLSGSTAWGLVVQPEIGVSLWRFPAGGLAEVAVKPDALASLYMPTIELAVWPRGVIVTGERCDDHPRRVECASDSGIVQIRDADGSLETQLELWHDKPTHAGGSSPTFLGLQGDHAWFRGLDDAVEVDATGSVVSRVSLQGSGLACLSNDSLYQVEVDTSSTIPSGPGVHTLSPGEAENPPQAKVTMERWTGSSWDHVANGTTTDLGSSPDVMCRGGQVTAWDDGTPLANWTAKDGWVELPVPAEPLAQHQNLYGQMTPAVANNGGIYRLDDRFRLERLEPATGKLVDAGLVLEPRTANTKAFVSVEVAENDSTVFACAGRATGLPGGPATPGTVCGFAAVPS